MLITPILTWYRGRDLIPPAPTTSWQRARTGKGPAPGPVRGRRKRPWFAVTLRHCERLHTPTPTTCILQASYTSDLDWDTVWAQIYHPSASRKGEACANGGTKPLSVVSYVVAGRSFSSVRQNLQGPLPGLWAFPITLLTAEPNSPTQPWVWECLWAKLHLKVLSSEIH